MYKYWQPNKKDVKDDHGDCVIRALCKVFDKSWCEVFKELVPICLEIQSVPNDKYVYSEYLRRNGAKYTGISNKKGSKRPTVSSFAKEHKQGTYYLRVAKHGVAVVDGIYYDSWDSGNKCVYGYWEVKA